MIEMDFLQMHEEIGHKAGFKYLLNVVEHFSRYSWLFPLSNRSTESVIKSLKIVFMDIIPKAILSDNGKEFSSAQLKAFLDEKE